MFFVLVDECRCFYGEDSLKVLVVDPRVLPTVDSFHTNVQQSYSERFIWEKVIPVSPPMLSSIDHSDLQPQEMLTFTYLLPSGADSIEFWEM